MAYHRRRNGKSVFRVAQNVKGLLCSSDESYVGSMTANLMGSKYCIWDKVRKLSVMALCLRGRKTLN